MTSAPDEPKEVRLVVTVKSFDRTDIGKLDTNGEYSATIDAPMCLSDAQLDAPLFASGADRTGTI